LNQAGHGCSHFSREGWFHRTPIPPFPASISAYSQKARVEAGTHVSPEQHGASGPPPHSCPFAEHLPPLLLPVPLNETLCGLPAALSEIESVPTRVPAAVGVNVTAIVQFAPGARTAPQVFVWAKLLSPTTFLISSGAAPELISVIDRGALAPPTNSVPNVNVDAERETWGEPACIEALPQPQSRMHPRSATRRHRFILPLLK
jgi:hypothetical protein